MTFEDAVWIGLGLKVDEDGTVTPKPNVERVDCQTCGANYMTANWRDKASCKWCFSSNVWVSSADSK